MNLPSDKRVKKDPQSCDKMWSQAIGQAPGVYYVLLQFDHYYCHRPNKNNTE